jgi:hypothetical protein
VEAPGANDKVYGFGLVDWCDGWFDGRFAPGRTAAVFCAQVRAAVDRSRAQGRQALVLADNLRTHTPAGSKLVRQMLTELQDGTAPRSLEAPSLLGWARLLAQGFDAADTRRASARAFVAE